MLPDETELDDEHKRFRKLTPTEPAIGGPNVKPAMVTVTTADAAMAAPEVVMTTAVLEVAPHVAVKPATLLAPEPTVGTTEDAKKFAGYERVKMLPDATRPEGENTSVTGTDTLPDVLPEAAIPNVDKDILKQSTLSQRTAAVKEDQANTGVLRFVIVPSPTCAKTKHSRQTQTRLPRNTQQPPQNPQQASLGRIRCIPSTKPRRCSTTHRNASTNLAS
jgi:hypothetical protein